MRIRILVIWFGLGMSLIQHVPAAFATDGSMVLTGGIAFRSEMEAGELTTVLTVASAAGFTAALSVGGWTAASIDFGGLEGRWASTEVEWKWRERLTAVDWPGMRIEPDYAAVAAAGRRQAGGGAPALAALALLLLTTRRW